MVTGLMLDLSALVNLSLAYKIIGIAKYIHVCKYTWKIKVITNQIMYRDLFS